MIYKITEGYVEQAFDEDGKLVKQKFVCGYPVEYENEDGSPAEDRIFYAPFDMVQPTGEEKQ
jgi:hypothetical protein